VGISVVSASAGDVLVAFDAAPDHLNLRGLVYGGMLAILTDTACGLSIRSAMEPGRLHVTTDLDIHLPVTRPTGTALRPGEGDQGGPVARLRRSIDRGR
jgi:acyl-coenzyme A thioesterase PaaI-like protein